ncbi:alpha/beta fold hydrolase [Chondrinema litorale]|uniref:alpha/beta fold hydrolase n=1 Tax=Chondrinema litorale TaxID=2994555 RepID=UPI002543BDC2|nr:alpha/beta fold hydrolase [Chondrinema litorale]UZR92939.1 alpha/beta fold hydrolase [Chondrinema litorale]
MDLFFREVGQGSPVIILHGLFGSSDNWASIAKTISNHYKVYTVDQRNHGQSQNTDAFDYNTMADDLYEFIQAQNIDKPSIVGHSMGGKVAMTFALKYPEIVNKLVIVDIGPKAYPPHHQKILAGLNAVNLKEINSRKDADSILAKYEPTLGVRQFLLKNLYRNDEGDFDWRINVPVITKKITNVGIEIKSQEPYSNPVLFIRGANSHYIQEEDYSEIREIFPRAQIRTINNAGHWVHAEDPKTFVQYLYDFI